MNLVGRKPVAKTDEATCGVKNRERDEAEVGGQGVSGRGLASGRKIGEKPAEN